ncbi:MAG: hypothetical protein ACLFPR_16280 [Desulfococcaceae bacterium]
MGIFKRRKKNRKTEEPKVTAETAQGTVGKTKSLQQEFSSESRKGEIGRDIQDSVYNQGDRNVTTKTDVSIGTAIFADPARSAGEIFDNFQGKPAASHPPASPTKTDSPILLDVHHIRNFDLKTVVVNFSNALNLRENAFGFSLNVSCATICRRYVIERLRDVMKGELGSEVAHRDLYLRLEYEASIALLTDRLRQNHREIPISSWFSSNPQMDFMISLWNYGGIPNDSMARISSSAWKHFQERYSARLRENGQRLVLLFVTQSDGPVVAESLAFQSLNVPASFDSKDLRPYFRNLLIKEGLGSSLIEDYLDRLSARSGKIADAYREMESIIDELKGMPTHARR